jgi:hypothetical protein
MLRGSYELVQKMSANTNYEKILIGKRYIRSVSSTNGFYLYVQF